MQLNMPSAKKSLLFHATKHRHIQQMVSSYSREDVSVKRFTVVANESLKCIKLSKRKRILSLQRYFKT